MTRRVLLFAAVQSFVAVSGRAQVSTPPAAVTSGGAPRGVTLALTEYNRLSDLASSASAATPPVAAVLSTADLRVRVEPEDGSFRPASDSGPFSAALRMPVVPVAVRNTEASSANAGLQSLVERYRSESGERRVMGALPVDISVPGYGPSTFLASELTPEGQSVSVSFKVKHVRQ